MHLQLQWRLQLLCHRGPLLITSIVHHISIAIIYCNTPEKVVYMYSTIKAHSSLFAPQITALLVFIPTPSVMCVTLMATHGFLPTCVS